MKVLIGILVACVVIAIGYFVFMDSAQAPAPGEEGLTGSSTVTINSPAHPGTVPGKKPGTGTTGGTTGGNTGTPAPAPLPPVPSLIWHFSVQGASDPNGHISTDVSLQTDTHNYTIGTFLGTCKTVADADIKTANEVSAVTCTVNGKGVELGVFRAGTKFVAEKADIQAAEGGTPAMRGVFTNIVTLDQ